METKRRVQCGDVCSKPALTLMYAHMQLIFYCKDDSAYVSDICIKYIVATHNRYIQKCYLESNVVHPQQIILSTYREMGDDSILLLRFESHHCQSCRGLGLARTAPSHSSATTSAPASTSDTHSRCLIANLTRLVSICTNT